MSHGRPWTSDDTAWLRRLTAAGWAKTAIAEEMGRDRKTIGEKCEEHGIEPGISRAARAIIARLNLRRLRRASA